METYFTTFNDPVHGTIELHPLGLKIIDTPEFQRLRSLKQCGVCDLVYPSAVHSRFEHCIGVYHLAEKFVDKLKANAPEKISDEEALCVKIGGLMHDIGHGPFSHLWERFIKCSSENEWTHEEMSLILVDRLFENNDLKQELKNYNLNETYHLPLIKSVISGEPCSEIKIKPSKLFLLEIVANKRNNIDVDRWEYMMRDAYFFGVICPLTVDRIFPYITLKEVNNELRIAFRDKLEREILKVFECRMELHRVCYQHRVCKNVELMITDALKAANDHIFDDGMKLSDSHLDIERFLSLNDSLMNLILFSQKGNLVDAQKILRRIQTRDLYSRVDDISLKSKIPNQELEKFQDDCYKKYSAEIRMGIIDINMGSNASNPLEGVIFYTKRGDTVFPQSKVSSREIKLLVFSVNQLKEEIAEHIRSDLRERISDYM